MGVFFDHVMEQLEKEMARTEEVSDETVWRWFRKIRSEARREPVHGKPEHLREVIVLTGQIREAAQAVSIETPSLNVSTRFGHFLDSLTDNELQRIIMFIRDIRNIRACRDRFNEVVDQRYIAQTLGLQPSNGEELATAFGMSGLDFNFMKDFHAYLRPAPDVVREVAGMNFAQLTLLMDYVSNFRSQKFHQGRVTSS